MTRPKVDFVIRPVCECGWKGGEHRGPEGPNKALMDFAKHTREVDHG